MALQNALGVSPLISSLGGTGINNGSSTITIGGNLTTSGAFASTFTMTNTTSVTFPTSGTLLSSTNPSGNYVSNIAGTTNQVTASAATGAVTLSLPSTVITTQFGSSTTSSTTSPTSTTASFYLINGDTTNNNWTTIGFVTPDLNLAALVGAQVTNHSTNLCDLVLFGRNNSSGVTEGFRLVGSTNTVTLANPLGAASGGTGNASYVIGDLLQASASTTLSRLAAVATGNALISGGVTTASSWGKIGLTTHVTGLLPLANGGTNANLTASNGGIFYSTASAGAILSGTATANQVLLSGASTTPAWSTATYPATTTINQLLYSSSANVIAGLATANSGVLITSSGGAPSISSTLPTAVQNNITNLGTIASIGAPLGVGFGGTGTGTGFTAGSVVFAGASGVYAQDNANFFWNSSTHNLGIGNTSPAGFLDVQGSASSSGALYGTLLRSNLTITGSGTGTAALYIDGTHTINGSGTNTVDYIQVASTVVATSAISTITTYNGFGASISGASSTATCYTMKLAGAAAVGAGGLTNAYTLFLNAPSVGTNKTTLYTDDISIGSGGMKLSTFTANGSTLWAVGSNCPGHATVQKWIPVSDGSNTFYIPVF